MASKVRNYWKMVEKTEAGHRETIWKTEQACRAHAATLPAEKILHAPFLYPCIRTRSAIIPVQQSFGGLR